MDSYQGASGVGRRLTASLLVTLLLGTTPLALAAGRPPDAPPPQSNPEAGATGAGGKVDGTRIKGAWRRLFGGRGMERIEPGSESDRQVAFLLPNQPNAPVFTEVSVNTGNVGVWQAGKNDDAGVVEGDLRTIAEVALQTELYKRTPYLDFLETAPASSDESYTYRVDVRRFRDFRDEAGNFILVVDAELHIKGPGISLEKPLTCTYPKGRWLEDDEAIKQKILSKELAFKAIDAGADVAEASGGDKGRMISAGLRFFSSLRSDSQPGAYQLVAPSPTVERSKTQEAVVRLAVEQLMEEAAEKGLVPDAVIRVPINAKKPGRKEPEAARGWNYFEHKEYKEAIAAWESLPNPSVEVRYNLGVAHLKEAAKLMNEDLPAAQEHILRAKEYLDTDDMHKTLKGQSDVLIAPSMLLAELGEDEQPDPTAEPSGKYALLIGVGKFKHDFEALKGPRNDLTKMTGALRAAGFKPENIVSVPDEKATQTGIRDAIGALRRRTDRGSLVVVFVASHGVRAGGDGFIICHDTSPESPYETGWMMGDLRAQVAAIPGASKIYIQDTCHADATSDALFPRVPPMMVVFASCQARERAAEIDGQGIMTKHWTKLVEKSKGRISMADLSERVTAGVSGDTGKFKYLQQPKVQFGPYARDLQLNR